MTANELSSVVRTLSQSRKLEVKEEHMFDQGNVCYQAFEETGSLQAGHLACRSYFTAMRAMRDGIRYHAVSQIVS